MSVMLFVRFFRPDCNKKLCLTSFWEYNQKWKKSWLLYKFINFSYQIDNLTQMSKYILKISLKFVSVTLNLSYVDFAPFSIFVILFTPRVCMHKFFIVCRCTATQIKDFDLLIPTVICILKSDNNVLSYDLMKKSFWADTFSSSHKKWWNYGLLIKIPPRVFSCMEINLILFKILIQVFFSMPI